MRQISAGAIRFEVNRHFWRASVHPRARPLFWRSARANGGAEANLLRRQLKPSPSKVKLESGAKVQRPLTLSRRRLCVCCVRNFPWSAAAVADRGGRGNLVLHVGCQQRRPLQQASERTRGKSEKKSFAAGESAAAAAAAAAAMADSSRQLVLAA